MAILTEFLLDITISSTLYLGGGGRFGRRQETAFLVSAHRRYKPAPLGTFETNYEMAASASDLTFDLDDLTKK